MTPTWLIQLRIISEHKEHKEVEDRFRKRHKISKQAATSRPDNDESTVMY